MLWSLGFLGNHELSMLSKVTVVGIFANRKVSATLRTLLGQKNPKRCEFVPEFHDSKDQERKV